MKRINLSHVRTGVAALGLSLSLAPLIAMGAAPNYRPPSGQSAVEENSPSHKFAREAAIAGAKEIGLSKLALQKSQDPAVRQFAQRMVQDHTQADRQLRQIAQMESIPLPPPDAFDLTSRSVGTNAAAGVTPSGAPNSAPGETPKLAVRQSQKQPANAHPEPRRPGSLARVPEADLQAAHKLQGLTGAEFDHAYAAEMAKDHRKVVQEFSDAAQQLDDPRLKQFAASTLPALQNHQRMAEQLEKSLGTATSARR